MQTTFTAHHGAPRFHPESALLNGLRDQDWLPEPSEAYGERSKRTRSMEAMLDTASSTVYTGHLGVLRQENPTLERQRRYDFWFKTA